MRVGAEAMNQPGTLPGAREFSFSIEDFRAIRQLIHRHAGILLADGKRDMVYSRLARRLRALRFTDFSQYLRHLRSEASEWQAFVNALTTNLTAFFREPHHFQLLREFARTLERRPIRIWCAACSTGEEAYSIAMTLADLFGASAPVQILATDIDTQVLEQAKRGVYALDRAGELPESFLNRFFLRGRGDSAGLMRIKPELRASISFRQLNLLQDAWPLRGPFDAIFCRNVMIYFDRQTQYRVLRKFPPLLHADSLLFAGHAESFQHATDLFRPQGRTVYALTSRRLCATA